MIFGPFRLSVTALISGAAFLLRAGPVFAQCGSPSMAAIAGRVTTEKQPRIDWAAVSKANAYRVHLQSRGPEGRVVSVHDTVVKAPTFLPPQSLAEHHAKVTVRVSAVCGSETSAEAVSWFLIDTSPTCRLGEMSAVADAGTASLRWQPVAGAVSYEVRAYGLLDGRLMASQETRAPEAKLGLSDGAVVSVRPACASGLGEAVYRVLAR
jgi:hypothetical protein